MNQKDREQIRELNKKLDALKEEITTKHKKIEKHFRNQYREGIIQSSYTLIGIAVSYIMLFVVLFLKTDINVNEQIILIFLIVMILVLFILVFKEWRQGKRNLKEWFEEQK